MDHQSWTYCYCILRSHIYIDNFIFSELEIWCKLYIHNKNDIALYPCYERVTSYQYIQSKFQSTKDLYVGAGEEIPPNAPKTRVKPVQDNYFVNYDHAGCRSTRISQT